MIVIDIKVSQLLASCDFCGDLSLDAIVLNAQDSKGLHCTDGIGVRDSGEA